MPLISALGGEEAGQSVSFDFQAGAIWRDPLSKTKPSVLFRVSTPVLYQFVPAAKVREERQRGWEIREAEGVHGSASNTFISLLLSIQEQRAHAYSTEH